MSLTLSASPLSQNHLLTEKNNRQLEPALGATTLEYLILAINRQFPNRTAVDPTSFCWPLSSLI